MNYSLSSNEGCHLSQRLGNRWTEIAPDYRRGCKIQLSLNNPQAAKAVYLHTSDLNLKDRIARAIPSAADTDHASQYQALQLTADQKKAVKAAYPSMLPYNIIGDSWRVSKAEADVLKNQLINGTWFERPKGGEAIAEAITKTFPKS